MQQMEIENISYYGFLMIKQQNKDMGSDYNSANSARY